MTELGSEKTDKLAKFVLVLIVAFLVVGSFIYGSSSGSFQRVWQNLLDRPGGPMTFRIILQPVMVSIAAIMDGLKDANSHRSPYLWTILTSSSERGGRLREGLTATARVILLAIIMDIIYQWIVFKSFYPGEAAIVAILLAFIPYLFLRGPVCRIVRWWQNSPSEKLK